MTLRVCLIALCLMLSPPLSARDFSKLFKQVDPAVVVIFTEASRSRITQRGVATASESGVGSGVIVTEDGQVLTAAHVVENADNIEVHLADGSKHRARVVSSVPPADVALIQLLEVEGKLPHVKVSDSDDVDIGAEVFVVGAPYGLEHTLTVGNLSGRRSFDGDESLLDVEFLQTDAAVNKGNSGGPMFSGKGKLIGIVSHIRSQSGGSEGLGFAASTNMIEQQLLNQPPIWFGMEHLPIRGKLAEALNIGVTEGFLVQRVADGSLGEGFGLRESLIPATIDGHELMIGGDIIIKLGGENVFLTTAGRARMVEYINSVAVGDPLQLTVLRNGQHKVLTTEKR